MEGVVTARRTAGGRGVWIQDLTPDADIATSDGVFVFLNAAPVAQIGDLVGVNGTVSEFRPGGDPDNLTITQITSSNASVTVMSSGNPLPAPIVLGPGGRVPPTENIDDDGAGNVETAGTFDAVNDAIDFYESLEGMRLQANDGAVVGATRSFGEITLLPDEGSWATGLRTARSGILLGGYEDPNPERIIVDDEILRDLAPPPRPAKAMPDMNVGDSLTSPVIGPLDYSFSNYKIQATSTPLFSPGGLVRETTAPTTDHEVSVATFNVENLAGTDPQAKYDHLAELIVNNLRAPDIIGIEEVQDNDGVAGGTGSTVVDASVAWARLVQAIQAAGGPTYQHRQIDPVDDAEGGAPGGNIRVGFLFRTDRDVEFIDRPGGGPTTETTVVAHPSGPRLSSSPGRIGTQSPAFDDTRKSLVGEFRARGKKLFVVVNHFSSKTDDQPLFGPAQPPTRFSEVARHGQAQVVHDFVETLLAVDPDANVIVLGDINDFEFSQTVDILEAGGVAALARQGPARRRSGTRTCSRATRRFSTRSCSAPTSSASSRTSTTSSTSTPSSPTPSKLPTTNRPSCGSTCGADRHPEPSRGQRSGREPVNASRHRSWWSSRCFLARRSASDYANDILTPHDPDRSAIPIYHREAVDPRHPDYGIHQRFVGESPRRTARRRSRWFSATRTLVSTASASLPGRHSLCGLRPPLPAASQPVPRDKDSELPESQRVGGHDGACDVRPVGPIPRPCSCDVMIQADAPDDESADRRDDAHPIRNGFTIRGLRQAEEQGSDQDRDAGRGEDEPPVPLTSRLHDNPSSYVAWPGR